MRISGVNIPDEKQLHVALTYIYGVGPVISQEVLKTTGIEVTRRAKTLTSDEVGKIQGILEKKYHVEGELRQLVRRNVERMKELGTYRGARHSRRLPVRGQRTRTNSRTIRGNVRKTAGSGKRKVDLK